jgi:hypothetical protein
MTPLRNNCPAGLPSPRALLTAIDALSRRYVLPETVLHPVVVDQARELALLLSAYAMTPPETPLVAPQSGLPGTRPRKRSASLESSTGIDPVQCADIERR